MATRGDSKRGLCRTCASDRETRSPSTTQKSYRTRRIYLDPAAAVRKRHATAAAATKCAIRRIFGSQAISTIGRNELPLTAMDESRTRLLTVVAIPLASGSPEDHRAEARRASGVRLVHTPSINRWWAAKSANSTRLDAPSLLKMCVRWDLTVFSVIEERAAISRFE